MKHIVWVLGLAFLLSACSEKGSLSVLHSGSYKFYPGLPTGTIKQDYTFKLNITGEVELMYIEAERYKITFNGSDGQKLTKGDSIFAHINVRINKNAVNPRTGEERKSEITVDGKLLINNKPQSVKIEGCHNCGIIDLQKHVARLSYKVNGKRLTVYLEKFDEVKSVAAP
jgi:hypothetical protein